MSIKQKLKNIFILSALLIGSFIILSPDTVSAVTSCVSNAAGDAETNKSAPVDTNSVCAGNNDCGVDTAIIKCDPKIVDVTKAGTENNGVWALLLLAINILTAGVGIAAVGGIVYGSILYTSAGGNAEQTKKAIEFIRNVIIGVVAYAIMFSFLNFIVPGGVFSP
jgi:hypothetical protein